MSIKDYSVQENIERMPWWLVAFMIASMTVIFGAGYYLLTLYSPGNGIKATEEKISFLTCIYFSIVTESTLGDGNISPHGTARAIVSFQVLMGLVVAGLLVAKIVSAPSGAASRLSTMAEGDWVDCVTADKTGVRIFGRTWIQGERNGLSFQGMDYLEDGTRVDTFVAHSLALSRNKVSFAYRCFDYAKTELTDGVSTLSFYNDKNRRYTRYSITMRDSLGNAFSGRGIRLSETELKGPLRGREECTQECIRSLAAMFDRLPKG